MLIIIQVVNIYFLHVKAWFQGSTDILTGANIADTWENYTTAKKNGHNRITMLNNNNNEREENRTEDDEYCSKVFLTVWLVKVRTSID